jgi:serine acetyltransferase
MGTSSAVAARLRRLVGLRRRWLILRLRFAAWLHDAVVEVDIRPGVLVGRRIHIEVGRGSENRFTVLGGSKLGDDVLLRLRGGEVHLGEQVDVRAGAVLNVTGGRLVLDGPNNLGWGVVIHCEESVHLAKHVHVAEYSTIVDSSHYYTEPDVWSYFNSRTRPVEIGEDVWMGTKATVASGVTIGDHTIVASGSVVVRDAPPGVLLSGVPAQPVRELDQPWRKDRR